MRRARFTVSAATPRQFDGANSATVLVEIDGPHALVRVRPYRRRREFILPLSAVAGMVIFRVAKADAADKARERRAKRRM